MPDVVNPYIAGNPVTGAEMFFGREDVFTFVQQALTGRHRDNVIVLYGQRRTGKTSILYQMHRHLDPRYLCILVDMHGLALEGLNGFLWELAGTISRVLRNDFQIDVPRPANRDQFLADARSSFENDFLNQVWAVLGDRHILLLLDEAVRLQEKIQAGKLERDVFEYLRHLMQHFDRLNFLFSLGSGLEEMEKEYAFLFSVGLYKRISLLEHEAAMALITQPVKDCYQVDPAAIDRIMQITSGHAYYTQLLCHSLFNRWQQDHQSLITVKDVVVILNEVVERGFAQLKHVWEESTPGEKAMLAGLAAAMGEHNRPIGVQEIERAWAKLDVVVPDSERAKAIKSLIARDVLAGKDKYTFTIELQRLWTQQYERVEWVKEEIAADVQLWRSQVGTPSQPRSFWRGKNGLITAAVGFGFIVVLLGFIFQVFSYLRLADQTTFELRTRAQTAEARGTETASNLFTAQSAGTSAADAPAATQTAVAHKLQAAQAKATLVDYSDCIAQQSTGPSKIGIHIMPGDLKGFGEFLKVTAESGAPIPVIVADNLDMRSVLEQYSPQTMLVFHTSVSLGNETISENPIVLNSDPREAARQYMNLVMPVWAIKKAHYYEVPNIFAGNWDWQRDFYLEVMNLAEANGYKLALYIAATGDSPDVEGVLTDGTAAQAMIPVLQHAKQNGHILSLHEFGGVGTDIKTLRGTEPEHALHYRALYENTLIPNSADLPLILTVGEAGGREFLGASTLIDDLCWYDSEIKKDKYVIGAAVWTFGGNPNANLSPVLPQLSGYLISQSAPVAASAATPILLTTTPTLAPVTVIRALTPTRAPTRATPIAIGSQPVDLLQHAPTASWTNSSNSELWLNSYPTEGDDNAFRGFAVYVPKGFTLETGETVQNDNQVVQTHPEFRPNGEIRGSFLITLPPQGAVLSARLAFLAGASQNPKVDGVQVDIYWCDSQHGTASCTLIRQANASDDGKPTTFIDDLTPYAGQTGEIQLVVNARSNSTSDWLTWTALTITLK